MFSCAQREKRVKKRGEEKRREKTYLTKKIPSLLLSLLFFWKDQNERPPVFFWKKKKEKKSRVTHQNQRKKKEKKTIIKYIPRARVEMSKRLQVQRRKRPRGGYTKRVRRLFWWSVFISHVCATFTAQTEHVFFLFLLCWRKRRKFVLSRSLSFSCLKTTQQKREEKRRNENEKKLIKKNIIKNVAARALRKTSVLSFRVHHARDIFVMNRWRSSVFFIWTRMYLYITVYPPLLFCLCFFSSSSSSCFFGTLAKEVFAFSIKKKRKKEKSFFLRFSSLSFLVLSGAFERDKKKRALFFLLLSDANKRTNANASLRLKSTTGGRVQKDDARLKKVLFLFCCVVLCSCFWSGCCFVSRGEREKGTTKKAQKRKEKILSVQKIRVPLLLLLFSVPKTSRQRTKGVTK